jgi:hypothetical protein
MSFALSRVFVRSSTRLRLFFTGLIDTAPIGSFFVGSLTPQSPNDPPVEEAFIVQGSQVELVLGSAMYPGGTYQLHLSAGVVSSGAEIAPDALVNISNPAPPPTASSDLTIQELASNVFGSDIAWSGADWIEGADGDLDVVTGPENVRQAVRRRMLSSGLLWDDSYGLKADEFVDAPETTLPALALRSETQALADDRVKSATAKVLGADTQNPEQQLIGIDITLVDKRTVNVVATITAG